MASFQLELVSPEKLLLSRAVEMAVIPAAEGEMGVLAGHAPMIVARARKIQRFLSQPFHVAEVFTGTPGVFVKLEDTIRSFAAICRGDYDHLPEAAF